MGRIRVLSDNVANKIAAGEVVERPASVVKELLENSLDAGANRIQISVEAGGKKLISIEDDGCGMVRDDALLAFERHATSKIHNVEDLDQIATLGFRGEALPSIASVSRLVMETAAADSGRAPASGTSGTRIEIAGGSIVRVEDAGIPQGTVIRVQDLFYNVPARRKFLKSEQTELAHIAGLVTQYALAHPGKHFELRSATHELISASPAKAHAERIFQLFGHETLDGLIPLSAESQLERSGLPQPPPWRRAADYSAPEAGSMRLHGFVSKPEVQKLNRNSIYVFVNQRLVRDRLLQHALIEAYRNLLPPGVFPVVLLFLEMPSSEVDCNVHPAKTEVRFRQQSQVHDFVRDAVRSALLAARPVPQFTREISAQPSASQAFAAVAPGEPKQPDFALTAPEVLPYNERLQFSPAQAIQLDGNMAVNATALPEANVRIAPSGMPDPCGNDVILPPQPAELNPLASLKPLGQIRDSFIIAMNAEGLWIVDQHTAHERVLFERIVRERRERGVEEQRLLMPLIVELTPSQWPLFSELADELRRNGFEAEPFGSRTVAVKAAPAGIHAADVQRLLLDLLDHIERLDQTESIEQISTRIAATIACHAAVKVNMRLEMPKMEWLLKALAETEAPMTCPHGRPVALRYGVAEIQKAFKRTWGRL